jgi:rsbT co-antagonist protein RsbR
MIARKSSLPDLIRAHEADLLQEWIREQLTATNRRSDLLSETELKRESQEFLRGVTQALHEGGLTDIQRSHAWKSVRDYLAELSKNRAQAGFSPGETAMFVFSLKKPIFARVRTECANDVTAMADEMWVASELVDQLGLLTTDSYQRSRESVIKRQQEEMLELSTPVVKLWEGVLALPMIGTLDSARTAVVMETLLQRIVETGSQIAIIDITGVPQVDTLVAQHLLKTVTAARLMGAECIISGIRPQIAQTIVHLGVDLGTITTKASLADAFHVALTRTGRTVVRVRQNAQAQQQALNGTAGEKSSVGQVPTGVMYSPTSSMTM